MKKGNHENTKVRKHENGVLRPLPTVYCLLPTAYFVPAKTYIFDGKNQSTAQNRPAVANNSTSGGVASGVPFFYSGRYDGILVNSGRKGTGGKQRSPPTRGAPLRPRMETTLTINVLALIARLLSGASVRWIDSQPDPCQRVYFANHTSHLDALVLWSVLPAEVRARTRPVAAKDYWTAGWLRNYGATKVFNAILIDRTEVKVHQSPVDLMIREIGNRDSLIVFPEGGRGLGNEVGEFKSGLYYLCKKRPDLEAIPVYIENMNRILPRGSVLPVPLLTCITFGPPIWLEAGEIKTDFLTRARQAVLKLKEG